MNYLRHVLDHLRKDLRLEWRSRDSINGMLFFALLGLGVVVILARYILSGSVGFFDKDYMIWIGLLLIAVAFGVATQWH